VKLTGEFLTYIYIRELNHTNIKNGFQCLECVKYFTMFDGEAPMITSKQTPSFSHSLAISRLHQQI